MQQSPTFKALYDGLYPIVEMASPLDIYMALDVDQMKGQGLLNYGKLWGLRGVWGATTNGLIYDIDKWSTDRIWTGELQDLQANLYRNFIKMKEYINGRNYTLTLIKEAFAILLDGYNYILTVDEGFMNFTINITAESEVLNILYNMGTYDPFFLGKPCGIKYTLNYVNDNVALLKQLRSKK